MLRLPPWVFAVLLALSVGGVVAVGIIEHAPVAAVAGGIGTVIAGVIAAERKAEQAGVIAPSEETTK